MKKVAILTISLRGGGAEKIISYLLKYGEKNFEFHLILLDYEITYEIPKNIKIHTLNSPKSKILKFISIFNLADNLGKYLNHNNISTLISFLNRPNIIASIVKKNGWAGKVIISERNDPIPYYKSKAFGFIILRLMQHYYKYPEEITAISRGICLSLNKLKIKKCTVIYNPAPSQPNISCAISNKSDQFTFICIARFYKQKNHHLLLESFSKIRHKNCLLKILGDGPLKENLKQYAIDLKINDKVHFDGFDLDIWSHLKKSDCLVLSSNHEGFGNVILEAMACRVPVISTDCMSGPREILAPDTSLTLISDKIEIAKYGILTPVGSSIHLAEAMERIIEDDNLRKNYQDLSQERLKSFDMEKILASYFNLF
ncbi:glycosyltransferase [Thiothrix sp.]|jgi:N-acetylgalactosamine-N,N'-diacetylbacillosaminyl-diphospho-undecaprenol 4-alpha-N-acetylgalactosaminyltransferase|uniref:glycosyltransferase n=1 Tax=Thiothrix sp. TaxID=1032 RepID=UPI00257DAE15|nr:glycosyltransferase [Thiothrix sp.]